MGAFALAVLILLSFTAPVLAETNFRVKSETVTPSGDLTENREVSITLVLEETTSSLTGRTSLELKTDLVNPLWNIIVDSETPETREESSFNFVFDHAEYDTVTIKLSGNAPSVSVKTVIVLIEVKQEFPTANIRTITRYVTSGRIDDALDAIQRAESQITRAENAIADAESGGVDVTEANEFLVVATGFLDSANSLYTASKMNESIAAANNAYDNAVRAYDSARGASGHQVLTSRLIYAGIIIAILIIAVVVYQKRRWERL